MLSMVKIQARVMKSHRKQLERMNRFYDLRPFWPTAKALIWKGTSEKFNQQRGPQGPWPPINPITYKLRRFGSTGQPLQDQGLLLRSVTSSAGASQETASTLMIGTNIRYAELQQKGFSQVVTPKMKAFFLAHDVFASEGTTLTVPPRPFLYLDNKDKERLQKSLALYVGRTWDGKRLEGGLDFGVT